MKLHQQEKGYMLLEVILAMALVAAALGALMDCLGRCLAASRSVQNYTRAEMLLANKSAEFRLDRAQDALDQEGVFEEADGFAWRRAFEKAEPEGLWRQTITVLWTERGQPATDSLVEYRYLPQKQ